MFNFSKIYDKINWRNKPDKTTPIDATNLGKIDAALNAIDDRVVELGKKANDTDDVINELNSNLEKAITTDLITFKTISPATETNNPLTIAEDLLKTDKFEICYLSVSNAQSYAPVGYSVYELRHRGDTITINVVNYSNGDIYTNAKTRTGSWRGWKKATMTNI